VYAQVMDGSLRRAAETVGSELFRIVHKPETASELTHLKGRLTVLDDFRNWLIRTA
jgi:hypothetical protein